MTRIEEIFEKESFAMLKLPFSDRVKAIWPEDGASEKLDPYKIAQTPKEGFLMMPFDTEGGTPSTIIWADNEAFFDVHGDWRTEMRCGDEVPNDEERLLYAERFATFIGAIHSGEFQKLVLSRQSISEGGISDEELLKAYECACATYPRMMVYIVREKNFGTWIGCTPEILIAGDGKEYKTVALAGTVPYGADLELAWNPKNRLEQAIVADFVRERLRPLSAEIIENGPYTARAGHLAHIKTEFTIRPNDAFNIGAAISKLHPTPAVCGLPQAKSKQFIKMNEGYDRTYYSGAVGLVGPDKEVNLFVNLRCAKIEARRVIFYAGGGLVEGSTDESEWRETCTKMDTLRRIIVTE